MSGAAVRMMPRAQGLLTGQLVMPAGADVSSRLPPEEAGSPLPEAGPGGHGGTLLRLTNTAEPARVSRKLLITHLLAKLMQPFLRFFILIITLFGRGFGDGEVGCVAMEWKEMQVLFVGCRLPSETLLRAPEHRIHFTFSIVGA